MSTSLPSNTTPPLTDQASSVETHSGFAQLTNTADSLPIRRVRAFVNMMLASFERLNQSQGELVVGLRSVAGFIDGVVVDPGGHFCVGR